MNEANENKEELFTLKKADIPTELEKTLSPKKRKKQEKEGEGLKTTTSVSSDVVKNEVKLEETNNSLKSPINNNIFTNQVYEVVFYDNEKVEHKYYSYKEPVLHHGILTILDPFTSHLFKENILNKKIVTIFGRQELQTPELTINLNTACVIKCVTEAEWMSRPVSEAKDRFDELVLKTYREVSEQMTKVPNIPSNSTSTHTVIPINKVEHEALIGNLPITEDRSHLVKGLD